MKKSKEQLFLDYMADGRWHDNRDIVLKFGWAIINRKNEMQRNGGLEFEKLQSKDKGKQALWRYRLLTPIEKIDFDRCCLKSIPDLRQSAKIKVSAIATKFENNGQGCLCF